MNDFFWVSGHLGWGLFALIVFTCLWILIFDLIWRSLDARFVRIAVAMSAGWLMGSMLILLGFYLGCR